MKMTIKEIEDYYRAMADNYDREAYDLRHRPRLMKKTKNMIRRYLYIRYQLRIMRNLGFVPTSLIN